MRAQFFGAEASTKATREELINELPGYEHHAIDIRDAGASCELFRKQARQIARDRAHRGAAVARLGGARSAHRFQRQRHRHPEPARSHAAALPGSAVFFFDQQSLRRHA